MVEYTCPECQNTNGEHKVGCSKTEPKAWSTDAESARREERHKAFVGYYSDQLTAGKQASNADYYAGFDAASRYLIQRIEDAEAALREQAGCMWCRGRGVWLNPFAEYEDCDSCKNLRAYEEKYQVEMNEEPVISYD